MGKNAIALKENDSNEELSGGGRLIYIELSGYTCPPHRCKWIYIYKIAARL